MQIFKMSNLSPSDQAWLEFYRSHGLKNDPTMPGYKASPIVHEYMRQFLQALAADYRTYVLTGQDVEVKIDSKMDEIWGRMTTLEMMEANIAMAACKATAQEREGRTA
jgi:hypothetical protein